MEAYYFFSSLKARFEERMVEVGGDVDGVGVRTRGEVWKSIRDSIRLILQMSVSAERDKGAMEDLHSLARYSIMSPNSWLWRQWLG
jgi:hypothetical protein